MRNLRVRAEPGELWRKQMIEARRDRCDEAAIAAGDDVPTQIQTLTGRAIQRAARTYLNTENYVKVTRMPETK